jgi:hypothetical protein
MNREHARLVVDDREHWQYFKRFCTIYSMQPCIADEHYVPTLLALKKVSSLIHGPLRARFGSDTAVLPML